jgi:hypothetical protein
MRSSSCLLERGEGAARLKEWGAAIETGRKNPRCGVGKEDQRGLEINFHSCSRYYGSRSSSARIVAH